jgi:folylpolyglutamate synthase
MPSSLSGRVVANLREQLANLKAENATLRGETPLSFDDAWHSLISLSNKKKHLDIVIKSRDQMVFMMENYLKRLSIDISKLSIIHVAGTKGKGSTLALTESILRHKGYRTGLFTSPHLIHARERVRINGKPVSEELFLEHFWAVWNTIHATEAEAPEGVPPVPRFFYFLTLVGFRIFAHSDIDVVLLETGLGGRLDATNVVAKPVVCGITLLDLDHTLILGDTLALIAGEKAGIFKPGVRAYTVAQEEEAMTVLLSKAPAASTPLALITPDDVPGLCNDCRKHADQATHADQAIELGMHGSYQQKNAALALALAQEWCDRRHGQQRPWPAPLGPPQRAAVRRSFVHGAGEGTSNADLEGGEGAVLMGLRKAFWPGRAHTVTVPVAIGGGGESVSSAVELQWCLDGAHTLKSIKECVNWFGESKKAPGASILVFQCSHERDIVSLLRPIVQCGLFGADGGGTSSSGDGDLSSIGAIFCPLDFAKPSRLKPLGAHQLLEEAGVDKKYYDRVGQCEEGAEKKKEKWIETLSMLWNALQREHESAQGKTLSSNSRRSVTMPSIKASVEWVTRQAEQQALRASSGGGGKETTRVLATGSLYLVGGVLDAIKWTGDA